MLIPSTDSPDKPAPIALLELPRPVDDPRMPSDVELERRARERLPASLRDARYPSVSWWRPIRWAFSQPWLFFSAYLTLAVTTFVSAFLNGQPITIDLIIQSLLLGRLIPFALHAPLFELLLLVALAVSLLLLSLSAQRDIKRERNVLTTQENWIREEKLREHTRLTATFRDMGRDEKQSTEERERQESIYALKPVTTLIPSEYLFRYVADVYQPRRERETGADAEQLARDILLAARAPENDSTTTQQNIPRPLGILVVGRPILGKTRFAWEAMRASLPDALFVNWPHEESNVSFDFIAQQGKLLVLWLDDLQTYATDRLAPTLNNFPRSFARSRLVVIATCRDGADEEQARIRLGGLVQRLVTIRLADLSRAESAQLTNELAGRGVKVYRDEQDGTAGAPLLGVRAMREERYPQLPTEAKAALKAMKLLRSAGIYEYPALRVCTVAQAIFGVLGQAPGEGGSGAWHSAVEALTEEGFVRQEKAIDTAGRHALAPEDAYLEYAISDYPSAGASLTDDWTTLQGALMRSSDISALTSLAGSLMIRQEGLDPARPGDLLPMRKMAERCFQEALARSEQGSSDWLWAQLGLGAVLAAQATLEIGERQVALLADGEETIRNALRRVSPDSAEWFVGQVNLCNTLLLQSQLVPREEQTALLTQIIAICTQLLGVATPGTPEWSMAQLLQGIALAVLAQSMTGDQRADALAQAVSALQDTSAIALLGFVPQGMVEFIHGLALMAQVDVATGGERAILLAQAMSTFQRMIEITTPGTFFWAQAQAQLGFVLVMQAAAVPGEERFTLLTQAVEAYRRGFNGILPLALAELQDNLGDALVGLAEVTAGEEKASLLAQAIAAYREAITATQPETAQWGVYQNDLATALFTLSQMTASGEHAALLTQTEAALRQALIISPKSFNLSARLGFALLDHIDVTVGDEKRSLAAQAADAFQQTLDFADPGTADLNQIEAGLGIALTIQGLLTDSGEQAFLLTRAVAVCRKALETLANGSIFWGFAQRSLGDALLTLTGWASAEARPEMLTTAVDAYEEALTAITRTGNAAIWSLIHYNQAMARWRQADIAGEQGDAGVACMLLGEAQQRLRDAQPILEATNQALYEQAERNLAQMSEERKALGCAE